MTTDMASKWRRLLSFQFLLGLKTRGLLLVLSTVGAVFHTCSARPTLRGFPAAAFAIFLELTEVFRCRETFETSRRSHHIEPIFRLLLKVAVIGTRQCEFSIFAGRQANFKLLNTLNPVFKPD